MHFFPAIYVYWVQVLRFWLAAERMSMKRGDELPHAEHSWFQRSQSWDAVRGG